MSVAGVPDGLLGPLLDAAAEVLHGLAPAEVPTSLRTLAGFDRRRLAGATARQQLRRGLDLDAGFRDRVVTEFLDRPQVRAVLDAWVPADAIDAAAAAADRDDLAWWASALYAARPDGYEFGLGAACAQDRTRAEARRLADEAQAGEARVAGAEEARRRAEAALADVRAELTRTDAELRDERRSRREREEAAAARVTAAERAVREAEAALRAAERVGGDAEARARREADRARDAERRLREQARLTATPPPPPGPDPAEVADLAKAARDVTRRLEALARSAASTAASTAAPASAAPASPGSSAAPAASAPSGRRVAVPCPPGLHVDQPEAVEAMLRAPGVVCLVDGYNVSIKAWPQAPIARQREQLVSALHRAHLRLRSHAIVVFDGADVESGPARRVEGVRVVFSPPDRPADPVIIEQLGGLGLHVPVLVASDDHWVRDAATAAGATPVRTDALLAVLRR